MNGLTDERYEAYLEFKRFTDQLASILFQKNTDYGNAIAETGKAGCEVRLYDKLKRLRNLIENGENAVVGEPLTDAFWDAAGYSILWLMINSKSLVFYDAKGKVITSGGNAKKRLQWLKEQRKLINSLIKTKPKGSG